MFFDKKLLGGLVVNFSFKFFFFGDGFFDVVKERDEEVVVFSVMMIKFRLNFRWDDSINFGYVISFIIFYDYEIFLFYIDVRMVIYIEERQDILKFIFSVYSWINKIIEFVLSCLLEDEGSIDWS